MRLKESTLQMVQLAPRIEVRGSLGGMAEGFSAQRIPLRASILPDDGDFSGQERGALSRARLRLLVSGDANARPGDGICMDGKMMRILQVQGWIAHKELLCEEIP